ncbi:neuronal acetylcholine receptor subunit alpha-5-like isoform X2 [Acropora muricata]
MNHKKIAFEIKILTCILLVRLCRGLASRLYINESYEYKLRRELLTNMDVMVRPVKSPSDIVSVDFSMTIRSLSDLDDKRQVLITSVWIAQKWQNPFLQWDKDKFGGLDRIHVSPEEIWVPDIILYNNADNKVFQAGHTNLFKTWVELQNDGSCSWESPANLESECNVQIDLFPFDQQNCSLFFGSATYGSEHLVIVKPQNNKEKGELIKNGEWEIIKIYQVVFNEEKQRLHATGKFSFIEIRLNIKRQWAYYFMFLILPSVICTILVLFSFSIPPENGERIGFCSTVMIAVSVFLLLIADILPEKSDTLPILGVYYTVTMLLIAFALIATILVLRAYHSVSEPAWCLKALYRACKRKAKTNGKINLKKLFRRNAVANGTADIDSQAGVVPPEPPPIGLENGSITDSNDELGEEDNRKIWRSVAVSLDRFFFWVFLGSFITSCGYLVIYRPVSSFRNLLS